MKKVVKKIKKATIGVANSTKKTMIIGGNEVGLQLAEKLVQMGHNVIIVVNDTTLQKKIEERIDVLVVSGQSTNVEFLKKVGIEKIDLLVAVTTNDYKNLLTGIYAQKLGVDDIIIQVRREEYFNYDFQREKLGFNLVVNPLMIVTKKIKGLIRPGMELALDDFLDKRVQISKFIISHQSGFAYSSVEDLNLPNDSLLLAILRKGRVILPRGRQKIYPGDRVFILSQRGVKSKLGKLLSYSPVEKEKIVLAGGGRINYQLARYFAQRAVVTIIEEDLELCEKIAEDLPKVLVLQGAGSELDLLKEEGVAQADIFVAAVEDDETNLLMANLAKKIGVKDSIATVNNISYSYLTDYLELDYIISPSAITVDTILNYLYQGQVGENTLFAGQVQVSEIKVDRSNLRIKDLKLPAEIIIGLVTRNDRVIIPTGESKLLKGDKLVVFSLAGQDNIKEYFQGAVR